MAVKEILCFDRPGHRNTADLVEVVRQRAKELDTEYMVVASGSGQTSLRLWDGLQGMG